MTTSKFIDLATGARIFQAAMFSDGETMRALAHEHEDPADLAVAIAEVAWTTFVHSVTEMVDGPNGRVGHLRIDLSEPVRHVQWLERDYSSAAKAEALDVLVTLWGRL